ncbi:MAG: ASPIC/UnbV domain-containing protein, partial [Pseudomonadota bacterium]
LRQAAPNTRAVGAWVDLRVGDTVSAQEITVGGGHAGGSAGPLHFGLGANEAAEVRVIWPDGAVSGWASVTAGSTHVLRREARSPGVSLD